VLLCTAWRALTAREQSILAHPEVDHIPSCNDYYLRSEEAMIQLLRSPVNALQIK
jgi:hypothetical protein